MTGEKFTNVIQEWFMFVKCLFKTAVFHYKGGGQGGGVAEGEEEAEADGQDCDAREELLHGGRRLKFFCTLTINYQ